MICKRIKEAHPLSLLAWYIASVDERLYPEQFVRVKGTQRVYKRPWALVIDFTGRLFAIPLLDIVKVILLQPTQLTLQSELSGKNPLMLEVLELGYPSSFNSTSSSQSINSGQSPSPTRKEQLPTASLQNSFGKTWRNSHGNKWSLFTSFALHSMFEHGRNFIAHSKADSLLQHLKNPPFEFGLTSETSWRPRIWKNRAGVPNRCSGSRSCSWSTCRSRVAEYRGECCCCGKTSCNPSRLYFRRCCARCSESKILQESILIFSQLQLNLSKVTPRICELPIFYIESAIFLYRRWKARIFWGVTLDRFNCN